jgi:hypothetical protein
MLKLNLIFILFACLYCQAGFGFNRLIPMQSPVTANAFYPKIIPDSFFIVLENKWLNALEENDTVYLNELLDADFIDISYKGILRTKEDVLHTRIYNKNDISQQLTGMKVRRFKNIAIVTGINNISIKANGKKIYIRFTDVFIEKNKQWYAVTAQETLQD